MQQPLEEEVKYKVKTLSVVWLVFLFVFQWNIPFIMIKNNVAEFQDFIFVKCQTLTYAVWNQGYRWNSHETKSLSRRCHGMEMLALCNGNASVTCGSPSHKATYADLWYFLCCKPEQFEETVALPLASDLRCDNIQVMLLLCNVFFFLSFLDRCNNVFVPCPFRRKKKGIMNAFQLFVFLFFSSSVLTKHCGRCNSANTGLIHTKSSSLELFWPLYVQHHGHLPIRATWACPWEWYGFMESCRRWNWATLKDLHQI